MLAIEVTFLTGRYVATAYNTRSAGEWPPHPARLFSALVDAHSTADPDLTPALAAERAVLQWLETLGPPAIAASEARPRTVVPFFVPVNDVALTDVDDEAERLDEARANLDRAKASGAREPRRAVTAVAKAEASYRAAVSKATSVPVRPGDPSRGLAVLPDHRLRQMRRLPAVVPDDPVVVFVWETAGGAAVHLEALDALTRRVVRLGHSSSLVSVRLVDPAPQVTWVPADDGPLIIRVAQPGQLEALEAAFDLHRGVEARVMPALQQRYDRPRASSAETGAASVFTDEWLVLRAVGGPALPMTSAAGISGAIRRTLLSFAASPIPAALSGHDPDGAPSRAAHLAIVPLPFVGHAHATGLLLGVALVLPRDVSAQDRRAVFLAVKAWEAAHRVQDEDVPVVVQNLGEAGQWRLERVEWGRTLATLRAEEWCGPASEWLTATPIALDRHPGDLWARDAVVSARAREEARAVVAAACGRAGLPAPADVELLPAAPWSGAAKARQYPPFPASAHRTRRMLVHCRVRFPADVRGPVLLGAGRFLGLGLFRPWKPS